MDLLPSVSLKESLSAWPAGTDFAEGELNCGIQIADCGIKMKESNFINGVMRICLL
jgi:hypothetical protein